MIIKALRDPIAKLDGVSISGGAFGFELIRGLERLYMYDKNINWYYYYSGYSSGFSIGVNGIPVSMTGQYYNGQIYDNRKDKTKKISTGSYEGEFYGISSSAAINLLGKIVSFIPFGAAIFSSGAGGGLYGYAYTGGLGSLSTSSSGLSYSTSMIYYSDIGLGPDLDKQWNKLCDRFR